MKKDSKLQLTDSNGDQLVATLPKPKHASPVGSRILVELLSPQEVLGVSCLIVSDDAQSAGAPQGIVAKLGPQVKFEDWGIKVGDRVILQGKFVPLPELDSENGRALAIIEPYTIKAILT